MLCGLIRLVSRIKFWLKPRKDCHCFCVTCEYFDTCKDMEEYIETVFGEPFE